MPLHSAYKHIQVWVIKERGNQPETCNGCAACTCKFTSACLRQKFYCSYLIHPEIKNLGIHTELLFLLIRMKQETSGTMNNNIACWKLDFFLNSNVKKNRNCGKAVYNCAVLNIIIIRDFNHLNINNFQLPFKVD